jgi:ketosteroid isomerase-like protein
MADKSKATMDVVMSFMGAMGAGKMEEMSSLMANDMVWENNGDKALPWIGTWKGKETIFGFLGTFSKNVQVTHWANEDAFASGDTAAVFGKMKLKTITSGKETPEFNFALRAKVKDGQVIYWNWLEDTYAVSQSFHGK